jgi:2-keto-3-deoxy-L-rhamnonate aldolase RhmA
MVKAVGLIRMQQIYRIRRETWQLNQMLDEGTKGVIVPMY